MVSTKKWSSTTLLNIDKNKKNITWAPNQHYNDFWRIMWDSRLEWWCWKIQFCHHRNKLSFKIQIENSVIIHKLHFFCWSNICSFGEHKRLLSKNNNFLNLFKNQLHNQGNQFFGGGRGYISIYSHQYFILLWGFSVLCHNLNIWSVQCYFDKKSEPSRQNWQVIHTFTNKV